MPVLTGGRVRLAAIFAIAVALAACMAERPPLGPPVISPTKLGTLGSAPVKGAAARFAFAKVTGIPGTFAYAFDDSLKSKAADRGLTLVADGDPTATYQVKGYLSAIGDVNGILLVYVWDVFDANGNRIHRFSGQQSAPGRSADPWTGVTIDMIDMAASETIDLLADWARG